MIVWISLFLAAVMTHAAIPTTDTASNSIGMKFKRVPAGTFLMGNQDTLPPFVWWTATWEIAYFKTGLDDEKPAHRVALTQDFYIGAYEVTNQQFRAFKPTHGDAIPGYRTTGNLPVHSVTWAEADSFCQWLTANDLNGWSYRLPTEAEWEYACRAGTTTPWYTGDTVTSAVGNVCFGCCGCPYNWALVAGGAYPPNTWGLFDMIGNAMEWCADWYGPYSPDSATDPAGPLPRTYGHSTTDFRVFRGLHDLPLSVRSSVRAGMYPDYRKSLMGFRVVISDVTPVPTDSTPDSAYSWQQDVAATAPAPATLVTGEEYTDPDGRSFMRARLVQDKRYGLVFTQVFDSVVYVSSDTVQGNRASVGLVAQSLSARLGVLVRIANKYELACAGIAADTGEYHLTLLPELAYASGRPHPDVAYYVKRRLAPIPLDVDGPLFYDWNVLTGVGITECPNRDLLATWYTDIGEDNWVMNSGAARLKFGEDAWGQASCDYDIPGFLNGSTYYFVDPAARLIGVPTSWYDGFGNRLVSLDNGAHWSNGIDPHESVINPMTYRDHDTLVSCTWNGNLAVSIIGGGSFQYSNESDHGIEATACFLDDGTGLVFARAGGVAPYMYKYTSLDYGRSWTEEPSPFFLNNWPSNHPYHLKLQSGRILQACFREDGQYVFGESADQGETWFCRRLCETGGYTTITQTRDGLIHVCGDMDNRPGGSFIQVTFSEQWLREGALLPEAQWCAANPPAGTVSDGSVMEPAYFDSLPPLAANKGGRGVLQYAPTAVLSAAPNPFNPVITIHYNLGNENAGTITIYGSDGKLVRAFNLSAQQGEIRWNGAASASGLYFCRLSTPSGATRILHAVLVK